ncbi:copine family protein 2-like isoform X2 [Quillaja saponaria]|uniref:Copine family protein 2-like isoform X2 n=1 Tax=Quillaja saponaria TaxID=32244 RepID=A0AAD7VM17_QUISA|nr:copine family protein 2-like isoform X2 [Quillaja saponaria]
MDSDLSLLEIAGEDDSLLLPIQNEGVGEGHGSSSIFLCSPLQIPSSELSDNPLLPPKVPQTECRARFPGSRKPSSSSPKDGVNKDIINVNNSEAPKLSLEPQKMKRKKKGGGYNLRKSLAWDRAFFTEEGVLNPLELSMISGDYNKHNGGMLCAIHEEEQNPVSSNMDITSDPSEFQALEEKLFKQSSASNSLADGKLGACLLPKHDASTNDSVDPPSSAKRKVLAVHDVNRSGSKRTGCPRTVASSSTKASIKQPKVSKIPVPKANTHVISTPVRSTTLGASYSKKDQNACPVSNFEKSVGLKGVPKRAKNPLADKSITTGISVRQARRNVTNSRSEIKSAATPHHLLVTKVKAGIEVIPDPLLSSTGHPSGNMVESRKVAVFPTQNACSSGGNMQKTQFQSAKPSGLRMPSPSMGYFNQPKASTSNMLLQKGSQLCNPSKSSTPNIRKVGATNSIHEVRPANAPAKVSRVANDVAKSGTSKSSISDAKLKASLKVNTNSNQKAEVNVQSNTTDCEKVINQHQSDVTSDYTNRKPLEHAEEHKCASTEHNMMGQYTVGQTNGTLYEDNGSSTEFHQFTSTNQKAEVNDQSDSTGCEKVSNQQQSGAILDDTNRKSLEHAEEHRCAITVENMMGQFQVVQTNGTLYEDSGIFCRGPPVQLCRDCRSNWWRL